MTFCDKITKDTSPTLKEKDIARNEQHSGFFSEKED